ncbi:MAG: hypothetical protein E7502_06770 [Ruminococcus sp.]|nr:hypothetical protein [Ruminococcus sp.]
MKKMKRMKVMMTAGAMLFAGSIGILPESVTEQFAIAAGAEESIVASGEYKYNLTWTLDSEGTLTISGEGEMYEYSIPWEDYKNDIKSIVIEEGVTNIVWGVFYNYRNVTSVTIPASVSDISYYAFTGCSSLTALHVDPDNAEYISVDGVLYTKDKTKLVKYPDNKEGTEYVIPASVEFIEYNAFQGCNNLSAINVEAGNTEYASTDGVLFDKSKETLIRYPVNKPETEYVVPDGVESLAFGAFYDNDHLTAITLPDSMAWIGVDAFFNCQGLTSIAIPEGIRSIENSAFQRCENLTTVTIHGSITRIESNVFAGCKSLTAITLPETVESIGFSAFEGCKSLTSINIPDTVTSIEYRAFYGCESLTSIALPEGITKIENDTFYECKNLASVTLPATLTTIERDAFAHCESLTSITIPEGVTTIGSSAFSLCINLTSITLPEGLTEIGYGAFYGCQYLTDVTIPKSLTEIDGGFTYCYRLENVYYAGTEEEWNAIKIDDEYLLRAKIHFGGTTPPVMGDIDSDDKFSVTDIIFVQKLLFGQETLTNWQAADLNRDDHVDGFDLAIMKRLLLNSNRAESDQAS